MNNVKATPLITQVRTSYFTYDCGMAYMIRVSDGRFVIIDGNIGEYDEPDRIMELLEEQNVLGGKPTVAAWFITHPHDDHFRGFVRFCDRFGDRVIIEKVIYKFPAPGRCVGGGDLTDFYRVIDERPETETVIPSRGDRLVFSDAVFDVLFVCTDLDPAPIPDINDTSLVTRMELAGHRVMWLGDSSKQGADFLCGAYSKEELRCDMVQVGHHGYSGGSDELYRLIDPQWLLWPCPDFWYHSVKNVPANDYIVHRSQNVKGTFIAGQEETVLDLTKPIEPPTPYKSGRIAADIGGGRMCALHWSCLTGGGSGYRAMKLTFPEKGVCRLEAGDAFSLCQMIQRGQTALSDKYEFTFSGVLEEGCETFGIVFDHVKPMRHFEEKLNVIEQKCGEEFTYTLKVNKSALRAELFKGDEKVLRTEVCPDPCEIIIMLKNGALRLTRVEFENK